jgi:hypothetical protein
MLALYFGGKSKSVMSPVYVSNALYLNPTLLLQCDMV